MASETWAETSAFVCEREDDIAVLRIGGGMADMLQVLDIRDEYLAVLQRVAESDEVRGLLQIADQDSPGAETLGRTLADLAHRPNARYMVRRLRLSLEQFGTAIAAVPKPTVAALDRGTADFFLSVALAFDAIVATPEATVTFPSRELGVPPPAPMVYRLVYSLGARGAQRVLYGDADLTAEQALDLGLFDQVVPRAELEAAGRARLDALLALPHAYFAAAKAMLAVPLGDPADFAARSYDLTRPYYTEALEREAG